MFWQGTTNKSFEVNTSKMVLHEHANVSKAITVRNQVFLNRPGALEIRQKGHEAANTNSDQIKDSTQNTWGSRQQLHMCRTLKDGSNS